MMRSGNLRSAGRYLFLASAVLLAFVAIGGCNYDWTYFRTTFTGQYVDFVSAMPANLSDDGSTCTRQCSFDDEKKVNAVLFNFNIIGSGVTASDDMDLSIRPGDQLKTPDEERVTLEVAKGTDDVAGEGKRLLSREDFDVSLNCLSPHPIAGYEKVCSVTQGVSGAPNTLVYASNFTGEGTRPDPMKSGISVAVMIDQSGSMNGYVEPLSRKEYSPEAKTMTGGKANISRADFGVRATDYQAFRRTAVQSLINQLNPGDRAGIFTFGESVSSAGAKILSASEDIPKIDANGDPVKDDNGNVVIECQAAGDDESQNRLDFFGVNRCALRSTDFAAIQSSPAGRTPLWMAVKDVYNFMSTSESESSMPVRHILVITDGPDTCAASEPEFMAYIRYLRQVTGKYEQADQSFSCSDTPYSTFLDMVKKDVYNQDGSLKAASEIPVHISFIQMQARGYPDPDPAQQEIACLTGGHYTFINSNNLPETADDSQVDPSLWKGQHPLAVALDTAIMRFRYSIAGNWQAGVKVNDLGVFYRNLIFGGNGEDLTKRDATCVDPTPPTGIIGGASVAVGGKISVIEKSGSEAIFDATDMNNYNRAPAPGVIAVVDKIDFRGSIHLPSGENEPDCLGWLPLCKIAKDTTVTTTNDDDAKVDVQMKDPECMVVSFDAEFDVCRIDDAAFGQTCTGGSCCWGKCMPTNTNECKKNELDAVCNYVNQDDDTPCSNGGTCQKGECVVSAS